MDESTQPSGNKNFYSVRETAERLSISQITVYRRIENNLWPSVCAGTRRLIPANLIESLEAEAFAAVSPDKANEER